MTVEFSGPLFDGTADRLLELAADEAELQIAERVRDSVRSTLRARARHRTGRYESAVVVDRAQGDVSVTDRAVRYGGWLEGDWPRNARTGFPGYAIWTRALHDGEQVAVPVADQVLDKYIERMG